MKTCHYSDLAESVAKSLIRHRDGRPKGHIRAASVELGMPALAKAAARAATEPMAAAPIAEPLIQIELRRGPLHLNVRWPASAADDCTAWLRELSSGLLK